MGLNEDSLLKPFRQMTGQPAPGIDLGGWYNYVPNYDWHTFDVGFAPSATFGQWVSALARMYAIKRSPEIREKVLRLNRLASCSAMTTLFASALKLNISLTTTPSSLTRATRNWAS